MRLRGRGATVPLEVAAAVTGRPLAAAETEDGTWLVGTRDALSVVRDGEATRLPWESVQHADWDAETSTLRVEEVRPFGAPRATSAYVLGEAGALMALLRERVTASVVVQRRYPVSGRRGLTVVGRRAPSGDGAVTWATQFDPGLDPDDPAVRAVAEAALRELRASVGL